jgi:DNA-binding MarR family transcriptional regulator
MLKLSSNSHHGCGSQARFMKYNEFMGTYKILKAAKKHLVLLPGLRTHTDFDITVEIGYHESIGKPLTLKNLLLLNIASQATIRRHLQHLINDGMVVKHTQMNDQRTVYYTLAGKAHESFRQCVHQLKSILYGIDEKG